MKLLDQKRRDSEDSLSSDLENSVERKWPLWKKILIWSSVTMFIFAFVVFVLIWIIIPIIFWQSINFQRLVVFMPFDSPKNPKFNNPKSYGIEGVLNCYISVIDYHNSATVTKIGAWLVLPEDEKGKATSENIPTIISSTKYDILIYLHGVFENRAEPVWQYEIMRKEFLVIAVDHRGYGDSGLDVTMTELGIVHDHLQIYDWIMAKNFTNNIYYWGHSLGAALSCHTVKALKEERNVTPKGLVLESAFTTLAEEAENFVVGKMFKWLVYFNATILAPLDYNGFHFYSSTNVLSVDCPIMIMHAQDDGIIPWFLGQKLANIATTKRDIVRQGNVTFHLFPSAGYGHNYITQHPDVPQYITNFKKICHEFIIS